MRPIAFVLTIFVASAPAAAQGWEEYSYPDYAVSVASPANPQVDTTTYQIAEVPAAFAKRIVGQIETVPRQPGPR